MMRSSAYNRLGVLMGTSWPASCPRWYGLREDSLPMITLFPSQGDFYATAHCHYNLRHGTVTAIRDGSFYPTRFASPQGALIPLNPQESLVLYRPKSWSRQPSLPFPAQQLWLFEQVKMA